MARWKNGRFVKKLIKKKWVASTALLEEKTCDHACLNEQSNQFHTSKVYYEGRRIVELDLLAKQLDESGCMNCHEKLHLTDVVKTRRHGCADVLYLKCQSCRVLTPVDTGKKHYNKDTTKLQPIFDINSKIATAMYHTGMGGTQINNFLAALDIPGIHHKTLKKREEEVAKYIHHVAKETCEEALQQEIIMSEHMKGERPRNEESEDQLTFEEAMEYIEEADKDSSQEESVNIAVKYDMGWQRRSSGRKYNSLSGVGCMIGNECGKVINYGVRNKDCRVCTYHNHKGSSPPEHKCYKNFDGSSKSMESDVGGCLVKAIESDHTNVKVGVLIMDDDSTTIARIRNELDHSIEKWSDIMHVKKHLCNALYKLLNTRKYKILTSEVIKYLSKCFSYAINQNKGNTEGVRSAILNIVPHAFGDHEKCGDWCGYNRNRSSYVHKTLPHGKDLSGQELRESLQKIFTDLACNAEKIAPCGTTRENESFNAMVSAKAPKNRHYSSSGSLQTRVDAVVAQKIEELVSDWKY